VSAPAAVASSRLRSAPAVAASSAAFLAVAITQSAPAAPLQPILPAGATPSGPFVRIAIAVGLDRCSPNVLAAISVVTIVCAVAAFVFLLREAWRGRLSLSAVLWLAVLENLGILLLPLLVSHDVYSYAMYGRIVSVYHANPYVTTPADLTRDPWLAYVGPKWAGTPSVYGPAFVDLAAAITWVVRGFASTLLAFRVLAVIATLATVGVVARLAGQLRPSRAAFAVALVGVNPLVVFFTVASGHNDVLVGLAVVVALALTVSRREVLAVAVLTLGMLVKAPAAVPLLLLVLVVAARHRRGERLRALAPVVGVVGGIVIVFATPFWQARDPTLGLADLSGHTGWLAPSSFLARAVASLGRLAGIDGLASPASAAWRGVFAAAFVVALCAVAWRTARRARAAAAGAPAGVGGLGPVPQGVAWADGLVLLLLLGPVLLPWYPVWVLPIAWLLPAVPRRVVVGLSVALSLSHWVAEPTRFPRAFDVGFAVGRWGVALFVTALLGVFAVDLGRRLRAGTPLEEERGEVAASPRQGGNGRGPHRP
jgi:alpha-1,6-mannosyltransferase